MTRNPRNARDGNRKPPPTLDEMPDDGYVRQADLLGPGALPFSAATLWRLVGSGRFPRPIKLAPSVTAWRVGDIRRWLEQQTAALKPAMDSSKGGV